jgi:hypothetical protein
VQANVFGDMVFRDEMSRPPRRQRLDPASKAGAKLPVMADLRRLPRGRPEPRQDGSRLARRASSSSAQYRPASWASSLIRADEGIANKASGNYGILDQGPALQGEASPRWRRSASRSSANRPAVLGQHPDGVAAGEGPIAAIGESGASFPSGPQPPLGGATLASAEAEARSPPPP